MSKNFSRADEDALLAEAEYYEQLIAEGEPMTQQIDTERLNSNER